jgi:hypothetical protein
MYRIGHPGRVPVGIRRVHHIAWLGGATAAAAKFREANVSTDFLYASRNRSPSRTRTSSHILNTHRYQLKVASYIALQ